MSTATEGNPTAKPAPDSGKPSGALALLTATALGGLVGVRYGKAPLVLAAGAAAFALLNPRRSGGYTTAAPAQVPLPEPTFEPEPVQMELPPVEPNPVALWLAQQIDREERAAAVDLSALPGAVVAEEDYIPQSLLFEDSAVATSLPEGHFAALSQPAQPIQMKPLVPVHRLEIEPPLSSLQALEATESSPSAEAPWVLRIEPLPSLDEPLPAFAIDPGLFTSSPMEGQAVRETSAPVFEGGTLPDQIEVTPQPEPVVHLMPVLAPMPAVPPPLEPPAEPVIEIPVQLAAPGEASFDPPLLDAALDPWRQDVSPPAVEPPQPRVTTTLVDAEIVLRPRAPVNAAVVPRAKHGMPAPLPAEPSADVGADDTRSPDFARPKAAWRSMWGVE